MSDEKQTFLGAVGSGLGTVGKVSTSIGAIVTTVVGVTAIIIAIYLLTKKNNWIESTGKVTDSICGLNPPQSDQNPIYSKNTACRTTYTYEVDGQTYTGDSVSGPNVVGSTIKIQYDKDHPSQSRIIGMSEKQQKLIAYGIIGVALLFIAGSWFMVWLTRRSPAFAKIEGGLGVGRLIF